MAVPSSGSNGEPSRSSTTASTSTAAAISSSAANQRTGSQNSPSATDHTDASGKPLARAVLVCRRCRAKKIKCDQAFPACGSCVKAGEACVGIDSATGREVSRSYIVDLEHQLAELRAQNAELERLLAEKSATAPAATEPLGLKRPLQHVESEFPLDPSEASASSAARPTKRLATSPHRGGEPEGSTPLLPGLVLGPAGVQVAPPGDQSQSYARPTLGRFSSHASGLSPARLLCQAIQQSAQADLRIRDPASTTRVRRAGAQSLGEDLRKQANGVGSTDPSKSADKSREEHNAGDGDTAVSKAEAKPISPHSRTATPFDSKKNSPFDDGDPMLYATSTETSDITVPAPEQLLKPSPLPAPFPPLSTARKLIDAYFERVNPQLPILDRASFMTRFETACKHGLEVARSKLMPDEKRRSEHDDDKIAIELQPADGHLFHLVFAIAAAMGWTRSSWSAENHHEAAMRFLDPRRMGNPGHEGSVGAIMGRDALEQLQCLLLTALYSIMRPMKPGVWYCLGVALRLTTGIGLYTEMPGVLEASAVSPDASETLVERKRRLFWCSYALDRQVCVHLGRPFGIADSDIKVNLPWVDKESDMVAIATRDGDEASTHRTDASEDDLDSSIEIARREAASTLATLQSSTSEQQGSPSQTLSVSLPKPKDASRWVSLSFFRMRILQSEIQSMLYQNAELPRRFDSYAHWKTDILGRLHAWRQYAPSSKKDLEASGCGYNPIFLELNYQQTLLMVYGLSPRFPNASRKDLASVEQCSRSIINMYATLSKEGQMNYTWMTGHNVFIACTSYLYAIWQISATDPSSFRSSVTLGFRNKVDEIHHFAAACDKVLSSLQWATAEKCRKCLRTMFYATSVVVEKIDRTATTSGQPVGVANRPNKSSGTHTERQQSTLAANTDRKQVRTSQASKQFSPFSQSGPSRASSSRERDWRQSMSNNAAEPAPSSSQQRWNQDLQGHLSPSSGSAWPIEAGAAGYVGEHAAERAAFPNQSGGSRLASWSTDPSGSDATTPSRGLDMGAGSRNDAWHGLISDASPKMLFPDSPSNFDISTLMATSAAELDALFREAGLSAGPSGEQGGWNNGFASAQQGGSVSSANFAFAVVTQDHAAAPPVPREALSSLHHPVATHSTAADGRDGWVPFSGSTVNLQTQDGGVPMVDGEGLETDWEALGFGYRMTAPSHDHGPMFMFTDRAGQHQRSVVADANDGLNQQSAVAHSARGAPTEFEHRFLDSHMGF